MKLIIDIDDKEKAICEQYINGKLGDELGDHINITELADAIADGTPITEGYLIMFRTLMTEIANKGLPFEEVLLLIDNAPTVEQRPQGECWGSCYLCDVGDCEADMRKGGKE